MGVQAMIHPIQLIELETEATISIQREGSLGVWVAPYQNSSKKWMRELTWILFLMIGYKSPRMDVSAFHNPDARLFASEIDPSFPILYLFLLVFSNYSFG